MRLNSARRRPFLQAAGEIALIFVVFLWYGGRAAPDHNEPHYLGKAKHYWDAAWCPRDLCFTSPDAHGVFYYAFGWGARLAPLPVFAWGGRLVGWALLAWAWRWVWGGLMGECRGASGGAGTSSDAIKNAARLAGPTAVLSAAVFVALQEQCRPAGEWLIGGFEAKVVAYALAFWGLGEILRDRWLRGLALLGAATSLHLLVGGWSLAAAAFCWLWLPNRPPVKVMIPAAIVALLLAAPGLLLALRLNGGVESSVAEEANRIYVFERLPHHLVPQRFSTAAVFKQLGLLGVFLGMAFRCDGTAERRLIGFVLGAVAITLCGYLIAAGLAGMPRLQASLLRLYWFRLADVMLPAGVALLAVKCMASIQIAAWRRASLGGLAAVAAGAALLATPRWFEPARTEMGMSASEQRDWTAVCDWVGEQTPADALFAVPGRKLTFKWRSGRSELVSWKEIPQDAAGVLEWQRRLECLRQLGSDVRAAEQLKSYGVDYVLMRRGGALPLRVVYENAHYRVYRLEG